MEPFKLTLEEALEEEDLTGIATLQSRTDMEDAIYNRAGQRVTMDKPSLPKGVYLRLKDGKTTKVLVK